MGRDPERSYGCLGSVLISGGVLAVLLGVVLAVALRWFDPQDPRLRIGIESPRTPVTGRLLRIKGTASFPQSQQLRLWIIVEGLSGGGRGGYWPQGEVRWEPRQAGHWSCAIALGTPDEREVGNYRIWAVLAEPRAHGAFARFVREKLTKGSDIPMENWPVELKRKVALDVKREPMSKPKYTSRGVKVSDNDRRRPAWCRWPPPPEKP